MHGGLAVEAAGQVLLLCAVLEHPEDAARGRLFFGGGSLA